MWSDNETSEDLLGFKIHASLISELVQNKELLPLSFGIFGDWGSGKSSIIKMIREELNSKDNGKVLCIYFNGWLFEGYDDAKAALIESILKELEKNEKINEKVKDKFTELCRSVDWMRLAGSLAKNVGIPALMASLTGGASLIPTAFSTITNLINDPKLLSEKLNSDEGKAELTEMARSLKKNDIANEVPKMVRGFREEFENLLDKTGLDSLVIIIDDLDRCNPERIIDNLEAIKLFLNVKKTAFIISADERIVRHAIEYRYKSHNINSEEIIDLKKIITDYLEKIIQIPYRLPKLSNSEVETYMTMLICKRDLDQKNYDTVFDDYTKYREKDRHSVFNCQNIIKLIGDANLPKDTLLVARISPMITEIMDGNPRQIKRFLNMFMLRKKLSEIANFIEINYELLTKLMILEYIDEERFRELFFWQQKGQGVSEDIEKLEKFIEKNEMGEIIKDYPAWESKTKWLRLEPLLAKCNLSDYFWLTRDKLTSSLDGSLLISTHIRKIFNEILDYTSYADLNTQIKNKLKTSLSESELFSFLRLLKQKIIQKPENNALFDIFHAIIDNGIEEAVQYYYEALQLMDLKQVNPSIGIKLAKITEKHQKLYDIIDKKGHDTTLLATLNTRKGGK